MGFKGSIGVYVGSEKLTEGKGIEVKAGASGDELAEAWAHGGPTGQTCLPAAPILSPHPIFGFELVKNPGPGAFSPVQTSRENLGSLEYYKTKPNQPQTQASSCPHAELKNFL